MYFIDSFVEISQIWDEEAMSDEDLVRNLNNIFLMMTLCYVFIYLDFITFFIYAYSRIAKPRAGIGF